MAKREIKISPQEAARILREEKVLTIETPLDEQPTRVVLKKFLGLKQPPSDISQDSVEGVVFFNLLLCYSNNGDVSEGQISDVMYGFAQSGIPRNVTLDGFKKLYTLKYITCTDLLNIPVLCEPVPDLFYKWTPKFFELLLDESSKEKEIELPDLAPEDTTVDQLEDN